MEYLAQVTEDAPVVRFSDKTLSVDGVTYKPKWAWSDDYRKHFRADHARPKRNVREIERAYKDWLIRRSG